MKTAASAMVALSLLGGGLGLAGYAAQNLPLCETAVVSVQSGSVCVSPQASTAASGAYRVARGVPHRNEAVRDLASTTNRVFHPNSPREAAAPDGELSVVSWNLHHGLSRDADGARPQLSQQIEQLNAEGAEVHLLQEVNPWDVQSIVDGTGMVGYFSQTNGRQGNMILVAPELEVSGNSRLTVNHDLAPGDLGAARSVVGLGGGGEPRAVQAVRVSEAGSSDNILVFNTHLSTGSASPEARLQEGQLLHDFLKDQSQSGDIIIGGGDFNQGAQGPLVQDLKDDGYAVDGARIDWLAANGAAPVRVEHETLYSPAGPQLSDHPIVRGEFRLPGH